MTFFRSVSTWFLALLSRILNLSFLIINSDALYSLLSAYIFYDLVNVVPEVEHHGITGAQFNGAAQTICLSTDLLDYSVFLVPDVEVSPDGYTHQQDDTHPEDQPETEGVVDVKKRTQFCPSLRFSEDASEHISH